MQPEFAAAIYDVACFRLLSIAMTVGKNGVPAVGARLAISGEHERTLSFSLTCLTGNLRLLDPDLKVKAVNCIAIEMASFWFPENRYTHGVSDTTTAG